MSPGHENFIRYPSKLYLPACFSTEATSSGLSHFSSKFAFLEMMMKLTLNNLLQKAMGLCCFSLNYNLGIVPKKRKKKI